MSVRLQQIMISVPFPSFILEIGHCVFVVGSIPYHLFADTFPYTIFQDNLNAVPNLFRTVVAWVAIGFVITSTAYFWLMQEKYCWVQGLNGHYYFVEKQKNKNLPDGAQVIFIERCEVGKYGCKWVKDAKVITTGDDL